jgi:SRSO17 transposase
VKRSELRKLECELNAFVKVISEGMGRLERREALGHYITGLLLEGERKSIQPMAERLAEDGQAEAMRQRLQQAVVIAKWSEQELFRRIALQLNERLPALQAFVIDDTGFPKKGEHSVGVGRQYSGTLGRVDNCQVATSLHLAGEQGSGCIGMRLYLSEDWAADEVRRTKAAVPDDVVFQTKGALALKMLDDALSWGLPQRIVLADAGYGDSSDFRRELERRGLFYAVGVTGTSTIQRSGNEAIPMSGLAETARFRVVTWRQGSRGRQSGHFARFRVKLANHRAPELWLLIEKTFEAKRPYKFYLSNLPPDTAQKMLVRLVKLRWRVERDYQELKGELGLDHFEGRTWLGFHHHVSLCAAAHAFLAIRRALFPPIEHVGDALHGAQAPPADPAEAIA